jgi:uridine kinase
MKRPLVIGVAGGTASGKTTIVAQACARLGALRVTHDRYYRNGDASTNFDHPDALETSLLVAHLDALRAGAAIDLPDYDFATHRRMSHTERVEPTGLIVVEGILVLADPDLRTRFDLSVFVDAPADIRLIRRMLRDTRERGRTPEDVIRQYLETVRPMHERFVQPSARHASLVLDGTRARDEEVGRLVAAAQALAADDGRTPRP